MGTPKTVLLIDDLPANLHLWSDACDLGIVVQICVTDDEDFLNGEALLVQDALSESIVFLDLGFRAENGEQFPNVVNRLRTMLGRIDSAMSYSSTSGISFPTGANSPAMIIPDGSCDGFGFLDRIIECAPSKCLVYVVSGRGDMLPIRDFCAVINAWAVKNLKPQSLFVAIGGEMPKDPRHAKRLFEEAVKSWSQQFPAYHEIETVEQAIGKWLGLFDELRVTQRGDDFCSHDHIAAAPDRYVELLDSCFPGLTIDVKRHLKQNDLKAVFDIQQNPSSFDPKKTFLVSKSSLGYGEKRLSGEAMKEVLKSIFSTGVDLTGDEVFALPCNPAFPFLVSLLALADRMNSECDGEGMLERSRSISLHVRESGPSRISIPLKEEIPNMGAVVGDRWLTKVKDYHRYFQEADANGSVCAALWDVLNSKVRHLNVEGESDTTKKTLLKLFGGPGRLVTGCTFGPHYIHIHW